MCFPYPIIERIFETSQPRTPILIHACTPHNGATDRYARLVLEEIPLAGGNATTGVVRVGDTVRKPVTSATAAVEAFTTHVASCGVDVPAGHGRDDRGRRVIDFVSGRLADDPPLTALDDLARVGALVRSIHDAADGWRAPADARWDALIPPPDAAELICHNDLTPWNLVTGERWVFIDWDGAGPSTRAWDLAYSAQAFAGLAPAADVSDAASRLRAFVVDGYRADGALREALLATLAPRAQAMHDMLAAAKRDGREPWGSMYDEGHGRYWGAAAQFIRDHQGVWRTAIGPQV